MRKLWLIIVDLVYEDPWQFLGPIGALGLVGVAARTMHGAAWLGLLLFALIAGVLFLSLLRER